MKNILCIVLLCSIAMLNSACNREQSIRNITTHYKNVSLFPVPDNKYAYIICTESNVFYVKDYGIGPATIPLDVVLQIK